MSLIKEQERNFEQISRQLYPAELVKILNSRPKDLGEFKDKFSQLRQKIEDSLNQIESCRLQYAVTSCLDPFFLAYFRILQIEEMLINIQLLVALQASQSWLRKVQKTRQKKKLNRYTGEWRLVEETFEEWVPIEVSTLKSVFRVCKRGLERIWPKENLTKSQKAKTIRKKWETYAKQEIEREIKGLDFE